MNKYSYAITIRDKDIGGVEIMQTMRKFYTKLMTRIEVQRRVSEYLDNLKFPDEVEITHAIFRA